MTDPDLAELTRVVMREGYKLASFKAPPTIGLNVSVAVGIEGGLSLAPTLRLVKAALLYSDHVTLYSIPAFIYESFRALSGISTEKRLDIVEKLFPVFGMDDELETIQMIRPFLRSTKKRHDLPPFALARRAELNQALKRLDKGMRDCTHSLFGEGLAQELATCVKAGLVTIQPIGEGAFSNEMVYHYLGLLQEISSAGANLPLLDEQSSSLLRGGIELGILDEPKPLPGGKHPALAVDLIERLPVLDTDMNTLLDLKKELDRHVKPFRKAMIVYSKDISAQPWHEGFEHEAELLYYEKVAPEIERISDALKSNSILNRAITALTSPSTLASGSVVGMAVGHTFSVSAAGIAGPIAGGIAASSKAVRDYREERKKATSNQLFFYYKASGAKPRGS